MCRSWSDPPACPRTCSRSTLARSGTHAPACIRRHTCSQQRCTLAQAHTGCRPRSPCSSSLQDRKQAQVRTLSDPRSCTLRTCRLRDRSTHRWGCPRNPDLPCRAWQRRRLVSLRLPRLLRPPKRRPCPRLRPARQHPPRCLPFPRNLQCLPLQRCRRFPPCRQNPPCLPFPPCRRCQRHPPLPAKFPRRLSRRLRIPGPARVDIPRAQPAEASARPCEVDERKGSTMNGS